MPKKYKNPVTGTVINWEGSEPPTKEQLDGAEADLNFRNKAKVNSVSNPTNDGMGWFERQHSTGNSFADSILPTSFGDAARSVTGLLGDKALGDTIIPHGKQLLKSMTWADEQGKPHQDYGPVKRLNDAISGGMGLAGTVASATPALPIIAGANTLLGAGSKLIDKGASTIHKSYYGDQSEPDPDLLNLGKNLLAIGIGGKIGEGKGLKPEVASELSPKPETRSIDRTRPQLPPDSPFQGFNNTSPQLEQGGGLVRTQPNIPPPSPIITPPPSIPGFNAIDPSARGTGAPITEVNPFNTGRYNPNTIQVSPGGGFASSDPSAIPDVPNPLINQPSLPQLPEGQTQIPQVTDPSVTEINPMNSGKPGVIATPPDMVDPLASFKKSLEARLRGIEAKLTPAKPAEIISPNTPEPPDATELPTVNVKQPNSVSKEQLPDTVLGRDGTPGWTGGRNAAQQNYLETMSMKLNGKPMTIVKNGKLEYNLIEAEHQKLNKLYDKEGRLPVDKGYGGTEVDINRPEGARTIIGNKATEVIPEERQVANPVKSETLPAETTKTLQPSEVFLSKDIENEDKPIIDELMDRGKELRKPKIINIPKQEEGLDSNGFELQDPELVKRDLQRNKATEVIPEERQVANPVKSETLSTETTKTLQPSEILPKETKELSHEENMDRMHEELDRLAKKDIEGNKATEVPDVKYPSSIDKEFEPSNYKETLDETVQQMPTGHIKKLLEEGNFPQNELEAMSRELRNREYIEGNKVNKLPDVQYPIPLYQVRDRDTKGEVINANYRDELPDVEPPNNEISLDDKLNADPKLKETDERYKFTPKEIEHFTGSKVGGFSQEGLEDFRNKGRNTNGELPDVRFPEEVQKNPDKFISNTDKLKENFNKFQDNLSQKLFRKPFNNLSLDEQDKLDTEMEKYYDNNGLLPGDEGYEGENPEPTPPTPKPKRLATENPNASDEPRVAEVKKTGKKVKKQGFSWGRIEELDDDGSKLYSGIDPTEIPKQFKRAKQMVDPAIDDLIKAGGKAVRGLKGLGKSAIMELTPLNHVLEDSDNIHLQALGEYTPLTESSKMRNEAGLNRSYASAVKGLSNAESEQVRNYLENPSARRGADPKIASAAVRVKEVLDGIRNDVEKVKEKQGKSLGKLSDYVPHMKSLFDANSDIGKYINEFSQGRGMIAALGRVADLFDNPTDTHTEPNLGNSRGLGNPDSVHTKTRMNETMDRQETNLDRIVTTYIHGMMRAKWDAPFIKNAQNLLSRVPDSVPEKSMAISYLKNYASGGPDNIAGRAFKEVEGAMLKKVADAYLTGSSRLFTLHLSRIGDIIQGIPLKYVTQAIKEMADPREGIKQFNRVSDLGMIPGNMKPFSIKSLGEKIDDFRYLHSFFDTAPDALGLRAAELGFLDGGMPGDPTKYSPDEAELRAITNVKDWGMRPSPATSIDAFNKLGMIPGGKLTGQFRQVQVRMISKMLRNTQKMFKDDLTEKEKLGLAGRVLLGTGAQLGGRVAGLSTWHLALGGVAGTSLYGAFGDEVKKFYGLLKKEDYEGAAAEAAKFFTGTKGMFNQYEKGQPNMIEKDSGLDTINPLSSFGESDKYDLPDVKFQ